MKHFFEWFLTALVSVFVAIIAFLIGRDGGAAGGAMFAGVCSGLCVAVSYTLGGMVIEESKFDGKRFGLMVLAGVAAGIIGGLIMLT